MIAPANQSLWIIGLVIVPGLVFAAFIPPLMPVMIGLIGLLVIVSIVDAVISRDRCRFIEVVPQGEMRLTNEVEETVGLNVNRSSIRSGSVLVGLGWPMEFELHQEVAKLPPAQQEQTATWTITPQRRGRWVLETVYLEAPSYLRLWRVREHRPIRLEIRVYPNLTSERSVLAPLLLHRQQLGVHTIRQSGQGREFEKLREYVPGDSFDDLHWKATAKRGKPITKVYQIERTQEIYLILDISRLAGRPTSRKRSQTDPVEEATTVIERAVKAALVLAMAIEREGDLVGLVTFDNQVRDFIKPGHGMSHYQSIRDTIYRVQANTVTPDFDELVTFLKTRIRRRSLLMFITALDDPVISESFLQNINLLTRQHLVLVNMVRPPGVQPIFSNAEIAKVDDIYESLSGHSQWYALKKLERELADRGASLQLIEHEQLSAELVSRYMTVKRRQLI